MPTPLSRHLADAKSHAADVLDDLLALLHLAGIPLPSVGVDWQSGQATGVFLIDLGAARPDVVERLVTVLRVGLNSMGQQSR
ncbi:hypothetical protein [Kitasatospora viridis]|uniref:Uncharacterized protein n=1 Tax=Kitasatospora viridis TaxID=281105 RepID=A0A561UDC1_9ACTN|nr:hypothetical protein [Kitasatospora viridis]TWF97370.1 hypothetical protein FHX73_111150 [Kitasatospora viridis]